MDEHYALTRPEAAKFLRVSLRKLDYLLAAGSLASAKVAGRRLIPATEVRRYFDDARRRAEEEGSA